MCLCPFSLSLSSRVWRGLCPAGVVVSSRSSCRSSPSSSFPCWRSLRALRTIPCNHMRVCALGNNRISCDPATWLPLAHPLVLRRGPALPLRFLILMPSSCCLPSLPVALWCGGVSSGFSIPCLSLSVSLSISLSCVCSLFLILNSILIIPHFYSVVKGFGHEFRLPNLKILARHSKSRPISGRLRVLLLHMAGELRRDVDGHPANRLYDEHRPHAPGRPWHRALNGRGGSVYSADNAYMMAAPRRPPMLPPPAAAVATSLAIPTRFSTARSMDFSANVTAFSTRAFA